MMNTVSKKRLAYIPNSTISKKQKQNRLYSGHSHHKKVSVYVGDVQRYSKYEYAWLSQAFLPLTIQTECQPFRAIFERLSWVGRVPQQVEEGILSAG
jgi:hypothetical protein